MRTACPVCGLPNLEALDCDHEPVDCLYCPRCGWTGDLDISENEEKTDEDSG